VFLTEDQAKEYADDLGLKEFKDLVLNDEIFNYGYGDIDGVFDESDEFEAFIKKKFKMTSGDWWDQSRKYNRTSSEQDEEEEIEMSDEEWKTFYGFCNLALTYINEVAFGDVFS
jgi:hypothetical protein